MLSTALSATLVQEQKYVVVAHTHCSHLLQHDV